MVGMAASSAAAVRSPQGETALYSCPICEGELTITPGPRGATRICAQACGRAATMEVLRRHIRSQDVGRAWQAACLDDAPAGRPCTSCLHGTADVQVGGSSEARVSLCTACHLAWADAKAWDKLPHRPPDPPKRSRLASLPPVAAAPPLATVPAGLLVKANETQPMIRSPGEEAAPKRQTIGRDEPDLSPRASLDTPLPKPPEWKRRNDPAALRGHFAPTEGTANLSFATIPGIPNGHRGLVTWGVIASLAVVGATTLPLPGAMDTFGFKPARPLACGGLPLVSSFYVHASLAQLLVSVYFLAALGDRVEAMLGTRRYLSTLLAGTVFGSLAYALGGPTAATPMVGAGAGITALIVLYGLAVPRARVSFLVFRDRPRLSVWSFLGIWALVQIVGDFALWGAGVPTPYSLQLAGGLVGIVAWFGVVFERPDKRRVKRKASPGQMVNRRRR